MYKTPNTLPRWAQVLIAFYQIMSVLHTTYSVKLPEYYTAWTDRFTFLAISWESLVGVPAGCVATSFRDKLFITTLGPIVMIVAVYVVVTFRARLSSASSVAVAVAATRISPLLLSRVATCASCAPF